jgi:anti-sigma B factor antagonist
VNELPTITNNGVLVVYIPDVRLTDDSRIEGLGAEIITLINRSDVSRILLNFRNVKFMGSAMIGKIIQVNKKCKEEKVDMRVCDLNDNLLEVFRLMKLDKILQIYPTEEDAIDGFAGKKKGWFS